MPGDNPSERSLAEKIRELRESGSASGSTTPRSTVHDDGTITIQPANGPARTYDPDDFRSGNYDGTDPYAPLSRKQCEQIAALADDGSDPDELLQTSRDEAIDRLRNPGDYPDPTTPGELDEHERQMLDDVTSDP